MNKLSVRFYLSNAFTCAWLIYNNATLNEEHDALDSENILYGVFLYLIILPGVYFSYIKAKELSYTHKHPLNVFEKIFIFLIYIFALLGNSLIAFFAMSFIYGGHENVPEWFMTANTIFNILAVGYIFAEGYVLGNTPSRSPAPGLIRFANFFLPIYTGIAISLVWHVFMLGGNLSLDLNQSDIISETIAACVLVLMIVLPFQRLLWFEIFANSAGWRANLKIVGSLIFVILAAILPLFF